MDEGVDPTKMCQSLVDKVAQSKQLLAIAHPEVLTLFENWLEELEEEILRLAAGQETDAVSLAEATGLSRSGAQFILAKLAREGRLNLTSR
jgi:DNA-binding GntR family transcriptional regulator